MPTPREAEEERRIAYVGMTPARFRLGVTYAAEQYGENARPSPFLSRSRATTSSICVWTGPRAKGADERSPLLG